MSQQVIRTYPVEDMADVPDVLPVSSLVTAASLAYQPNQWYWLNQLVLVGGVLYACQASPGFTSGASFAADGANWAPVSSAGPAPWQANRTYAAGSSVTSNGIIYTTVITSGVFVSAATWSADAANWTALTAAGIELAYAQITANATAIASGGTDIAGLSITFTMPNRPVEIEFWAYALGGGGAGSVTSFILDSSNNIWSQGFGGTLAAAAYSPQVDVKAHLTVGANANGQTLVAGTSYTFKAHCADTGGSGILAAGTGYPAFIRAIQG